jgi:hypothetical protein
LSTAKKYKKICRIQVAANYFFTIGSFMKTRITLLSAIFLAIPAAAFAAGPFEEKDFTWDASTSLHKALIMAGVNKIARDDPRCADIDPASAHVDYNHGNPDNPAFAVTCGKSDHPVTVFFTKIDVEAELRNSAKK